MTRPLPKSVRRKIRKRVRSEYERPFRDLDNARARVNRQHSKEVSSVQGATQMGLGAVNKAIARIPEGLGGRIEGQLTNELQAMKGDVRMGGRQQVIAANQAQREGLAGVRQDTQALRADRHDAVQSTIEDMKAKRKAKRVERRTEQDEERDPLTPGGRQAMLAAQSLIAEIPIAERGALKKRETWDKLATAILENTEGVETADAYAALDRLRRRFK